MQSVEVAIGKNLSGQKLIRIKKVDKVLLDEIFILINFTVKALTQVNSQQIWMNFNRFPNSCRVNCVTRINFNSDAVHKGWKLL